MKKSILFIICLAGGFLFGGLFFVAFGADVGYSWTLAWICAVCGLLFGIVFFIIWPIVQKLSKPMTFDNPTALKKLQECEQYFEPFDIFEARFHARSPQGRGLKSEVSETYVYLFSQKLHIVYWHFRAIYSIDVEYSGLIAYVTEDGFFWLKWDDGVFTGRLIDEDINFFINCLKEKEVYIQDEESFFNIENTD